MLPYLFIADLTKIIRINKFGMRMNTIPSYSAMQHRMSIKSLRLAESNNPADSACRNMRGYSKYQMSSQILPALQIVKSINLVIIQKQIINKFAHPEQDIITSLLSSLLPRQNHVL